MSDESQKSDCESSGGEIDYTDIPALVADMICADSGLPTRDGIKEILRKLGGHDDGSDGGSFEIRPGVILSANEAAARFQPRRLQFADSNLPEGMDFPHGGLGLSTEEWDRVNNIFSSRMIDDSRRRLGEV